MSPQLLKVEEQALLLPPEDREALVERLLQSLRKELPEIDPVWIDEAEKRYREYKEGDVEGIPAERVFEDVRQELGWSG